MASAPESLNSFCVFEDHCDQFGVPPSFRNIHFAHEILSVVTYVIFMDDYSLFFERDEISLHDYSCSFSLKSA